MKAVRYNISIAGCGKVAHLHARAIQEYSKGKACIGLEQDT